jgi:hypothetical protein
MTNDPVDLDSRRDNAARRAAGKRRDCLHAIRDDQAAARRRQEELEESLMVPADTWPEAASKAEYLIRLFAATPEAKDPRRKDLIAQTLDDLTRLSDKAAAPR